MSISFVIGIILFCLALIAGNRMWINHNLRKYVFLDYNETKIYHSWKGDRPLSYWYALAPNHEAEQFEPQDFDIRELPPKYTSGLAINTEKLRLANAKPGEKMPARSSEEIRRDIEEMQEAHKEALRRAIDDHYVFVERQEPKIKSQ
ncbi:hypothetical protein LJR009_006141 [Bosea sp. LjRoot9]|uniref:hypothetical protein n=1 Tax=Bosea sp. LjRoot9 TaxID=3342341 RepID=UPI003ECD0F5E